MLQLSVVYDKLNMICYNMCTYMKGPDKDHRVEAIKMALP